MVQGVPVETEFTGFLQIQALMQGGKAFIPTHGTGCNVQGTEVAYHIVINLSQSGTGLLYIIRFNGIGQADAPFITAFGNLTHQHIAVFLTDSIKLVALRIDGKHLLIFA